MFQTVQVVLNAQAKETNPLIPQGVWVSRLCALQRTVFNAEYDSFPRVMVLSGMQQF